MWSETLNIISTSEAFLKFSAQLVKNQAVCKQSCRQFFFLWLKPWMIQAKKHSNSDCPTCSNFSFKGLLYYSIMPKVFLYCTNPLFKGKKSGVLHQKETKSIWYRSCLLPWIFKGRQSIGTSHARG